MTQDSLRTLFRGLVVGQLVWTIVTTIIHESTKRSLPAPLRRYVDAQAQAVPSTFEIVVGAVAIVLTIVMTVGLYRFWRPVRVLYVAFFPLGALAGAFLSPIVQTGLVSGLYTVGTTISGVIIGLAFFSPVALEFEKNESPE